MEKNWRVERKRGINRYLEGVSTMILLFLINMMVEAMTITHDYEYYYIDPNQVGEFNAEMAEKGPRLNDRPVQALYSSTIHFLNQIYLKQKRHECVIEQHPFSLEGTITLPKLMHRKLYDEAILTAYDTIIADLTAHELVHEAIYQAGLTELEDAFNRLRQQFESPLCSEWKAKIVSLYDAANQSLQAENQRFDCLSYGIRKGYSECAHLADSHKGDENRGNAYSRLEASSEEGLIKRIVPVKKSTKVDYLEKNPAIDQCDSGELIEPFKGHYYCIH